MEMHRCNICFRNFANGRALGGHMRSHTMNFCASKNKSNVEKIQETDQLHRSTTDHSCSSSDFLDDPELSVVLQDGESDAESSRNNLFGRRSKRTRVFSSETVRSFSKKFGETNEEQLSPALSSVSDTTTEEDVARCLMMLSRDKWERENEDEEEEVEEEEDSGHVVKVKSSSNAKVIRGKYKCETCNKLFKSYQALGGHRASYKKIKSDVAARNGGGGTVAAAVAVPEKVHECPFCHRVFASGQALGGHKRSHFMGASTNGNSLKTVSKNVENFDIDLNLPAPIDDDDHQ